MADHAEETEAPAAPTLTVVTEAPAEFVATDAATDATPPETSEAEDATGDRRSRLLERLRTYDD